MTIGVVAPKGNVGSHVVRMLVQAGERPRVLLRDPGTIDPLVRGHVDSEAMDVWDSASVRKSTRGLETIYWVSPTAPEGDPVAAHRVAAQNLRAAIESGGPSRVVFQSSIGAEKRNGVGEIDGLAATEVELDDSGADVTHLRNGYFFSNVLMDAESIARGALVTTMDLDRPLPWVAPEDIAGVAVARLLSRAWKGRNVQAIHGPEDLTFAQAAEVLGASLGRDVTAQRVSDSDVRSELGGFGMSSEQVEAIVMMMAGLRDDFTPEDPRTYATTTSTTLRAWLTKHREAFMG